MIRECIGSILFIVVFASSASAQVVCTGPFLPVVPDGATTTEEELITIRGQVEAFMRDSDGYQRCLVASLRQLEAEAASDEDEEFNPAIRRRIEARVNTNQNHKIRVKIQSLYGCFPTKVSSKISPVTLRPTNIVLSG